MKNNSSIDRTGKQAYGVKEWIRLRSKSTTFLQDVAVTIGPFSGLSSNALAHLRSDWITWKDDFVTIRVPTTDECNQWKLLGGKTGLPTLTSRESVCSNCKRKGNFDCFENQWVGSENSEPRPYTATLHRDIAEPAIETLTKIFKHEGRSEISATPAGISEAADRLVDETKTTRSYPKLQRTGVSLYCHYGLDRATIANLTPYTQKTVENIEDATPEITRKYNNSYDYLQAIETTETATLSTLAEKLGVTIGTVSSTLKNLEQEDRVKADRSGREHTWYTIGDWTAPFICEVCGYESITLRGVRQHREIHR